MENAKIYLLALETRSEQHVDYKAKSNQKKTKPNMNQVIALINYFKQASVSAPVVNYILVDSGSHRLAVLCFGITEVNTVDVENEFLYLVGTKEDLQCRLQNSSEIFQARTTSLKTQFVQ